MVQPTKTRGLPTLWNRSPQPQSLRQNTVPDSGATPTRLWKQLTVHSYFKASATNEVLKCACSVGVQGTRGSRGGTFSLIKFLLYYRSSGFPIHKVPIPLPLCNLHRNTAGQCALESTQNLKSTFSKTKHSSLNWYPFFRPFFRRITRTRVVPSILRHHVYDWIDRQDESIVIIFWLSIHKYWGRDS